MYGSASISSRQIDSGLHELELAGELSVYCAGELHGELIRLAEMGQDVCVCCEKVAGLDTSVLQLLLAFEDAQTLKGRSVQFRGLPAEQRTVVQLAGLADRLAMPPAPTTDVHLVSESRCATG